MCMYTYMYSGDSKDTVLNILLRGPNSKKREHTHLLKP